MPARRSIICLVLAVCLLVIGPIAATISLTPPTARAVVGPVAVPTGCTLRAAGQLGWQPTLIGVDQLIQAGFDCDGVLLEVTVAHYLAPRQGQEAVSDLNRLSPDELRYKRVSRAAVAGGFSVVEHADPKGPRSELTVWTWYGIGDRPVSNPILAKFYQLLDVARFAPQDEAVLIAAATGEDAERVREALSATSGTVWQWFLEQRG